MRVAKTLLLDITTWTLVEEFQHKLRAKNIGETIETMIKQYVKMQEQNINHAKFIKCNCGAKYLTTISNCPTCNLTTAQILKLNELDKQQIQNNIEGLEIEGRTILQSNLDIPERDEKLKPIMDKIKELKAELEQLD